METHVGPRNLLRTHHFPFNMRAISSLLGFLLPKICYLAHATH
jgi:hypothetical protein